MKAFVLAAGRGKRMQSLTNNCPKPLLDINGTSLLEHQLIKVRAAGISEVVINTAYLGDMIVEELGDGSQLNLSIAYSNEPEPLETGGAILHALPLLGDQPFLLVNSDVWTDLDYATLIANNPKFGIGACDESLGHLVLVQNPVFNIEGDFAIDNDSRVRAKQTGQARTDQAIKKRLQFFTFSGVSILNPAIVSTFPSRRKIFPLREAFQWAIEHDKLSGELYCGYWLDVGTPERLSALKTRMRRQKSSG